MHGMVPFHSIILHLSLFVSTSLPNHCITDQNDTTVSNDTSGVVLYRAAPCNFRNYAAGMFTNMKTESKIGLYYVSVLMVILIAIGIFFLYRCCKRRTQSDHTLQVTYRSPVREERSESIVELSIND
ncbi:hypothetical protein THOM_3005 [Trachipleistophora hominis]|uniref:Transposable element encoded protein n=1 Tax=Trachipleistophora hominis TaxID=72359 RepID=L7JRF5_TRAHO|nr:hypothetical protein THOM_3005 [Trachipleistophora hominis]